MLFIQLFLLGIVLAFHDLQNDFDFAFAHLKDVLESVSLSQCSRSAVERLVLQCSTGGVESVTAGLRTDAAVKLSICEFQEAGVDFPTACHGLKEDMEVYSCIGQLRQSSQHWTTYSGNFQKINSICHESAMPFFKEHLVDLFLNVTQAYRGFYDQVQFSAPEVRQYFDDLHEQLHSLRELVEETVATHRHQNNDIRQAGAELRHDLAREQGAAIAHNDATMARLQQMQGATEQYLVDITAQLRRHYDEQVLYGADSARQQMDLQDLVLQRQVGLARAMDVLAGTLDSVQDVSDDIKSSILSTADYGQEAHLRIRYLASDVDALVQDMETAHTISGELIGDSEHRLRLFAELLTFEGDQFAARARGVHSGVMEALWKITSGLGQVRDGTSEVVVSVERMRRMQQGWLLFVVSFLANPIVQVLGICAMLFLIVARRVLSTHPVWPFTMGLVASVFVRWFLIGAFA